MRCAVFFIVCLLFLATGCITIELDEQGDVQSGIADDDIVLADNEDGEKVDLVVDFDEQLAEESVEESKPLAQEDESDVALPFGSIRDQLTPDEDTPEQQAYAQKRLAELRAESQRRGDAVPFDDFDSRELLSVEHFKVEKIAASRGRVEEILFTVRNYGTTMLDAQVNILVETDITNPESPRVDKHTIDLKEIPPGMKIEKRAYLNMEFRPLGYQRNYEVKLLTHDYPPKEITSKGGIFTLE